MQKSNLLIIAGISFLTGIGLDSFFGDSISNNLATYVLLAGVLGIIFKKYHHYLSALGLVLVFVTLGWMRLEAATHLTTTLDIEHYANNKVELRGEIVKEPDIRSDKIRYTVEVDSLKVDNQNIENIQGRTLITARSYPRLHYGDQISVFGKLQLPFQNSEFDYQTYLAKSDIYSVMYYPKIKVLDENKGNWIYSGLFQIKAMFHRSINRALPEPESSLASGILLGTRSGFTEEMMTLFNRTGITHIIAVSGSNVTINIIVVMAILSYLAVFPKRVNISIALLVTLLFILITGADATVVRAGIMGALSLLALTVGRKSTPTIAVLLAATLMTAWNPLYLRDDIGFQLSFLAVLGLIYFAPVLEKLVQKIPEIAGVKEAVLLTISAQVFALPIILLNFQELSIVAPLANLLILPLIPVAMLLSFLTGVLGLISATLGKLVGFVAYLVLGYQIKVVEILGNLPFASYKVEDFGTWSAVLYYIVLGVLLYYWWKKRKPNTVN